MMNQITIIGNLGKDVEVKKYDDFNIGKFSVAVNEKVKGEDKTEWFNVSTFDKLADLCAQHIGKGSKVLVQGKLQSYKYEKDGVEHTAWDVKAHKVVFLSFKEKENGKETEVDFDEPIPF